MEFKPVVKEFMRRTVLFRSNRSANAWLPAYDGVLVEKIGVSSGYCIGGMHLSIQ